MKKNKIDDFDITDTIEVNTPEEPINRFKTKEGRQSFKTRLISAIVLLILLTGYVSAGAIYTYKNGLSNIEIAAYFTIIASAILTGLCVYEMNKAMGFVKWYQQLITISTSVLAYGYPLLGFYDYGFYEKMDMDKWLQNWQFVVVVVINLLIYLLIGLLDKNIGITKLSINFGISLMIILAFKTFTMVSLETVPGIGNEVIVKFSFNTIIWVWLMIIFGDTFAYIGGMAFGKTKLAPKISPKKTWEGAAVGLSCAFIGGTVYALMFYFFAPNFKPLNNSIDQLNKPVVSVFIYILLSIAFPVIGLFGDLLFSAVKRYSGVKDFSRLIPGHGGLLDRLDSVIFSWFVLFFIIILI
ncbi:phosphatidate cytidylyltransferase [Spiroplasma chinense]|uniref:Phosphatidate cytidylyltransferase n=1 Tax=Spiroplasma chinense TaxID=216932 RepID=A0A5B9Y5R1_9MOLU|nr:phosphatidate cytidylyltransferase [Spiroplasma chinense]QEH62066.1 phosphatidate cytidylyltransferase [Spiroplasma chinense]